MASLWLSLLTILELSEIWKFPQKCKINSMLRNNLAVKTRNHKGNSRMF
jgi:hypothetical protein